MLKHKDNFAKKNWKLKWQNQFRKIIAKQQCKSSVFTAGVSDYKEQLNERQTTRDFLQNDINSKTS